MKTYLEKPKKNENLMGFADCKAVKRHFGNRPETAVIGGKTCRFRSQLELKTARYLELLKKSGHIKDWFYEHTTFNFPDSRYLVDFDVRCNDDSFYYIECKGFLTADAKRKLKLIGKYYPQAVIDMVFLSKKEMNKLKTSKGFVRRACTLGELTKGII